MKLNRNILFLLATAVWSIGSCSQKDLTAYMTSREHFEYAMQFFRKKDYIKAQEQLAVITFKYSGSDIADDAQFYLAESYYYQKDYVSAVSEYERLVSAYPRSEFVENSLYQLAICYYRLSPNYGLDQKYTREALSAIQNYMDLYPRSTRRMEVDSLYKLAHYKLARKEFENAETYRKISEYEAAVAYYDVVINEYNTTDLVPMAIYQKANCYYHLKEFEKARLTLQKLIDEYPLERKVIQNALKLSDKIRRESVQQQTSSRTQ